MPNIRIKCRDLKNHILAQSMNPATRVKIQKAFNDILSAAEKQKSGSANITQADLNQMTHQDVLVVVNPTTTPGEIASKKAREPVVVDAGFVELLHQAFEKDTQAKGAQNAVSVTPVSSIALVRDTIVRSSDFTFSIKLDKWKATNQKSSGRCWIFAALNMLRPPVIRQLKIKNFEFSQNWVMFWNKFEQSNAFMENISSTTQLKTSDRLVSYLLSDPISDGGQWGMFVNIAHKYGLVPQNAMPETQSSSSTQQMNAILVRRPREAALQLRKAASTKSSSAKQLLKKVHQQAMSDIWKILCVHLGTPPKAFAWRWRDENDKFHDEGIQTPHEFRETYVKKDLQSGYVTLVHDPRTSSEYYRPYYIQYMNNVVGGVSKVQYVNTPIKTMKEVTLKMLRDNKPVWMACDVNKMFHSRLGIFDTDLYDFNAVYHLDLGMHNKIDRIEHRQTVMTHAMLFTGVDIDPKTQQPTKWRIENSWGDKDGDSGFHSMSDKWFDEYVFEVIVERECADHVDSRIGTAWESTPIALEPWDAMGSVACK